MATRGRRAAAPVVEDVEEELDELEEIDDEEFEEIPDDEEEELEELEDEEPADPEPPKRGRRAASKAAPAKAAKAAPAKKAPAIKAAPAADTGYDSTWLAEHVTEVTGQEFDARSIRMVLRKLANDGTLERLVGEDRSRYSFTGPRDAQVVAVVRYVKSGGAAADKTERIAAAKTTKTAPAKKAAPAKAAPAKAATKAAPATRTRRRATT